jgi:hypothetical protein
MSVLFIGPTCNAWQEAASAESYLSPMTAAASKGTQKRRTGNIDAKEKKRFSK